MILPQIPLNFSLRESASFGAFIERGNSHTLAHIKASASASGEQYLYLWGAEGTGKSHLLQAACRAAQSASARVAYVPLTRAEDFSPEILADMGALDLVCLDDIQIVCGAPAWESVVFRLFNQLRERGARLLVSGDRPPIKLGVELADLGSRLAWGLVCQLNPLDDEGRLQLLMESASRRGLQLPDEAARYILSHAARDTVSLVGLMERLDRASLVAQRRLTVPFVKSVLEQVNE